MDMFSNILANEIKPGEEILWQGKPDLSLFVRKMFNLPIVLLILLFAHFLMMAYGRTGSLLSINSIIWWGLLVTVILGQIGTYYRVKKTLYVLTNQRAIAIILSRRPTITSRSNENLAAYTKTSNPDGSGNIVFSGGKRGPGNFLWLRDVKKISDLIDRLAQKPHSYVP
jgi:hypothetical protein